MITLVLMTALLGGVWRRWYGMNNSTARWQEILLAMPLTWSLWYAMPWPWAAGFAALCIVFFLPGHTVDSKTIYFRYPIVGAVYPMCKRYWPSHWISPPWIDGPYAVAEFLLGSLFWGFITFATLAGHATAERLGSIH